MKIYTVGMFKAFDECPNKYNLIYNEHLEMPADIDVVNNGKKIHTLINYKLKGENISKMLKVLDKEENVELKQIWQNFEKYKVDSILQSEYAFNVGIGENNRLNGRIDAIRQTEQKFEILDWKTGSSKNINAENDMQTIVYLYSLYKVLKFGKMIENPENLSMKYVFLKENTSQTVFLTQKLYEKYEIIIQNKITEIENAEKFITKDIALCQKCRFNIFCKGLTKA